MQITQKILSQAEYPEFSAELRHLEIQMNLEYQESHEFFEDTFGSLYSLGEIFSLRDIFSLLISNPELIDINRKVQASYLKKPAPLN